MLLVGFVKAGRALLPEKHVRWRICPGYSYV